MSEKRKSDTPQERRSEDKRDEEKKLLQRNIYEELASLSKAMAHPIRLEIIDLLSQRDQSVEELARTIGSSHANVSHHLQSMKKAGLVEASKRGRQNLYRIPESSVLRVWEKMRELGLSRNAELERLLYELHDRNEEISFSAEELMQKLEREDLVLIDVRPEEEFNSGHISSALSIPQDRLEAELDRIPKNKGVVAYCRGPFCVMSDQAVDTLRKNGYKATCFQEGFSGWIEKGFPVEKGKQKTK